MNAYDRLPMAEKLKMLKMGGEYITTVNHKHYAVSLYKLDNFLVESFMDTVSRKTIRISSADYFDLIKYLPHITINSIYNLID